MDSKERQTLRRAMSYKNYSTPTMKYPAAGKLGPKTTDIKTADIKTADINTTDEVIPLRKDIPLKASDSFITAERLQEAIIWSEIIGKPVSKRGKRR
jgi:hypothetical protein